MVSRQLRHAAVAASMLAAFGAAAVATPVQAQSKATVSSSESATAKVTIQSIDAATRTLTVKSEGGDVFPIVAPPEAHNFDKLKVGDKVTMTYTLATEFVLSAPNSDLPPDTVAKLTARTAKGDNPGGLLANQVVVTGAIIAIDPAKHTVKLVSPQGGAVHLVAVRTAAGREAMKKMKVGDTITAHLTESMLLSVAPL